MSWQPEWRRSGQEPDYRFTLADNSMQNGAPDGVALINTMTMSVVDALSYEGPITAATTSTGMTGAWPSGWYLRKT